MREPKKVELNNLNCNEDGLVGIETSVRQLKRSAPLETEVK